VSGLAQGVIDFPNQFGREGFPEQAKGRAQPLDRLAGLVDPGVGILMKMGLGKKWSELTDGFS